MSNIAKNAITPPVFVLAPEPNLDDWASHAARVVESTSEAFIAFDANDQYIYVNRSAERLLGRPRHELLGKSVWIAFPEILGRRYHREHLHARATQAPVAFEQMGHNASLWLDVRIFPMGDGLGVYFRDITTDRAAKGFAERLQTISVALAGVLRVEQVTEMVLTEAFSALQATEGTVHLYSPDSLTLVEVQQRTMSEDPSTERIISAQSAHLAIAVSILADNFIVCEDSAQVKALLPGYATPERECSVVAVPFRQGTHPFGGMSLYFQDARRFLEAERNFLTMLSGLGVAALERAQLFDNERRARESVQTIYEKEHRIAQALQRSLSEMPLVNSFDGFENHAIYRAALLEASVGGDFFDVFAVDANTIGLVVGDISGKGLVAAARSAEIRFALRAFARETGEPNLTLDRLNEAFCDARVLDKDSFHGFLCLSLAFVDTASGAMRLSVAGMESPIVVHEVGSYHLIPISGAPVGVFEDEAFDVERYVLDPGDLLIQCTDGFTEARNGVNFFGIDGLAQAAAELYESNNLQDAGSGILDRLLQFSSGALKDDICLLLTRRR